MWVVLFLQDWKDTQNNDTRYILRFESLKTQNSATDHNEIAHDKTSHNKTSNNETSRHKNFSQNSSINKSSPKFSPKLVPKQHFSKQHDQSSNKKISSEQHNVVLPQGQVSRATSQKLRQAGNFETNIQNEVHAVN